MVGPAHEYHYIVMEDNYQGMKQHTACCAVQSGWYSAAVWTLNSIFQDSRLFGSAEIVHSCLCAQLLTTARQNNATSKVRNVLFFVELKGAKNVYRRGGEEKRREK